MTTSHGTRRRPLCPGGRGRGPEPRGHSSGTAFRGRRSAHRAAAADHVRRPGQGGYAPVHAVRILSRPTPTSRAAPASLASVIATVHGWRQVPTPRRSQSRPVLGRRERDAGAAAEVAPLEVHPSRRQPVVVSRGTGEVFTAASSSLTSPAPPTAPVLAQLQPMTDARIGWRTIRPVAATTCSTTSGDSRLLAEPNDAQFPGGRCGWTTLHRGKTALPDGRHSRDRRVQHRGPCAAKSRSPVLPVDPDRRGQALGGLVATTTDLPSPRTVTLDKMATST